MSSLLVVDLVPSLDPKLEAFLKNFFLGADMIKLNVEQRDKALDDDGNK